MALNQGELEAVVAAAKEVPDGARLKWRARNDHVQIARVAVERAAIEVGELLLIVNVAHARHWSFKLRFRSVEARRWDFLPSGPRRHRNPPERPPSWPATVVALEHEHHWFDGLGTDCSRPLQDAAHLDHREAYARFCTETNVDPKTSYQGPPPAAQQLKLT